jgi:hypothetical protein
VEVEGKTRGGRQREGGWEGKNRRKERKKKGRKETK